MWLINNNIESNYLKACSEIISDENKYLTFKRNKDYQFILSGGEKILGIKAIEKIKRYNSLDKLKREFSIIKKNDIFGSPILHKFEDIGEIDPSTLKYYSDYIELGYFMSKHEMKNIIEIGGGYGGLAFIFDALDDVATYSLIDLEEPIQIQKKYLENLSTKKTHHYFYSEISEVRNDKFDLLIADASLAELSKEKIIDYLSLIKKSDNLFISFNTLHLPICRQNFKYLVQEIKKYFYFDYYFDHWNKALIFGSKKTEDIDFTTNFYHKVNKMIFHLKSNLNL